MSLTATIDFDRLAVYLLADLSGSMKSEKRLQNAQEIGMMLATEMAEIDDDGKIHFVTFGGRVKEIGPSTPDEIQKYFDTAKPLGSTPMGEAINVIQDDIIQRLTGLEAAHQLVVIITDGEPDKQSEVVNSIIEISKHITHDSQIAILFIQVGSDETARKYLETLDDGIAKYTNGFDIVDTMHFTDAAKLTARELILHAFND